MPKMNYTNFMVRVECMTYNHAPFIVNTMNGFTIQQTNFPYICVIIDDASTDGEQEIISRYLGKHFALEDDSTARYEETDEYKLIFARHKRNKNCFFAVIFLNNNHYSINKSKMPYIAEWGNTKYIALCEGDDYWINPQKLQIQIDFLESHNDYSLCHSDAEIFVYEKKWNKGRIGRIHSKAKSYDSPNRKEMFYRILTGEYPGIITCTSCFRTCHYKQIPPNTRHFMMGDKPLWLDLSQLGRVKYIDDVFAVYVKHQGSATRSSNSRMEFTLNAHEMKIYYCKKYDYPIPARIVKIYKRGYLSLFFSGIEKPILNISELSSFTNKINRMKENRFYYNIELLNHKLSSNTYLIKEKLNICLLLFSNIIWKTFK